MNILTIMMNCLICQAFMIHVPDKKEQMHANTKNPKTHDKNSDNVQWTDAHTVIWKYSECWEASIVFLPLSRLLALTGEQGCTQVWRWQCIMNTNQTPAIYLALHTESVNVEGIAVRDKEREHKKQKSHKKVKPKNQILVVCARHP